MAVSENERKIDNLRIEHEQQAAKLHEHQMEDDQNNKGVGTKKAQFLSPEVEMYDNEIKIHTKTKEKVDELQKKVNLVND